MEEGLPLLGQILTCVKGHSWKLCSAVFVRSPNVMLPAHSPNHFPMSSAHVHDCEVMYAPSLGVFANMNVIAAGRLQNKTLGRRERGGSLEWM